MIVTTRTVRKPEKKSKTTPRPRRKPHVGEVVNGCTITAVLPTKEPSGKTVVTFTCPHCQAEGRTRYCDLTRRTSTDKRGKLRRPTAVAAVRNGKHSCGTLMPRLLGCLPRPDSRFGQKHNAVSGTPASRGGSRSIATSLAVLYRRPTEIALLS
jgi:hypothetical protein